MHQTSMFAGNNRQQMQPQLEFFNLQDPSFQNQFANWNFNVGQPFDQHTPNIALYTIQEIQNQAGQGHPIRVGAFNILSENSFNNPSFQDLVYAIVMRVGYGVTNGEWRNMDMAVQQTIARCVKSCASGMAAQDPDFMNTLAPKDAAAVRENAEIWNYLIALAQGQAQYVPFSQMTASSGLSGVSGSTQEALATARNLRGGSGAFVDAQPEFGVTSTRYNNNASPTVGRYGRRAEIVLGKLQGSMQEALESSGASAAAQTTPYQGRMKRPNATGGVQGDNVKRFDSEVTDFSRPMQTGVTSAAPAPEPEQGRTLFTVQIGDDVVHLIRERKEGISAWKQSKYQRFHPAWCKRTHAVRYFESKDGAVIAVLQPLTQEQKDIAMNYEAHAIDPTKGRPEPDVPVRPVRPEAQALYAPADQVTVNMVTAKKFGMEEDVSGAIRSTRLTAEMSDPIPDAYVKSAIVNSPVVYPTATEADEDAIVIRAISGAKDFAEAATYLPKLRSQLARRVIGQALVAAVNRATTCELGVGLRIGDFEEDAAAVLPALEKNFGSLVSEKMRSYQTTLLSATVRVVPATEMDGYAHATLAPEDQDELSEDMLKRVLFLQRNVCTVWVNFTDDELAVGVPPKGPAMIQQDSLGAVYKIAKAVFEEAIGQLAFSEQFLITKDNVQYRLHRGLINPDAFLLSHEQK